MNRIPLSFPEIAIVAGTRAIFGIGFGLLIADYIGAEKRRAVGWTLLLVGLLSTIPIATQLFRARREEPSTRERTWSFSRPTRKGSST